MVPIVDCSCGRIASLVYSDVQAVAYDFCCIKSHTCNFQPLYSLTSYEYHKEYLAFNIWRPFLTPPTTLFLNILVSTHTSSCVSYPIQHMDNAFSVLPASLCLTEILQIVSMTMAFHETFYLCLSQVGTSPLSSVNCLDICWCDSLVGFHRFEVFPCVWLWLPPTGIWSCIFTPWRAHLHFTCIMDSPSFVGDWFFLAGYSCGGA